MDKFKYFEIDNRKFKLERVTEDFYELIVHEKGEFYSYCFEGTNAYGEALAEILSYSEITEEEYDT